MQTAVAASPEEKVLKNVSDWAQWYQKMIANVTINKGLRTEVSASNGGLTIEIP